MIKTRMFGNTFAGAASLAMLLSLGGCKAQQQMQQQIAQQDERLQGLEHRIKDLDNDLKTTRMDVNQMRGMVKQIGETVVAMKQLEDERQRLAVEAKAKVQAKNKKKVPPKKKHK